MIRNTLILIITSFLLFGCGNSNKTHSTKDEGITANQQKLLDEGWSSTNENKSKDISSEYGIIPIYGIHDNYFDIKMGSGSNLAMKIIDLSKNKCIRYIYVHENSEFTVSQIPQGQYKLLIAYGRNWMTQQFDKATIGKFADDVFYERSTDIFDFGKKNSNEIVNYILTIKVNTQEYLHAKNFNTEEISEELFYNIN